MFINQNLTQTDHQHLQHKFLEYCSLNRKDEILAMERQVPSQIFRQFIEFNNYQSFHIAAQKGYLDMIIMLIDKTELLDPSRELLSHMLQSLDCDISKIADEYRRAYILKEMLQKISTVDSSHSLFLKMISGHDFKIFCDCWSSGYHRLVEIIIDKILQNGSDDLIRLFIRKMMDLDASGELFQHFFYIALRYRKIEQFNLIIREISEIDPSCGVMRKIIELKQPNILGIVVQNGFIDLLDHFLSIMRSIDPTMTFSKNMITQSNFDLLSVAARMGHTEIVERLIDVVFSINISDPICIDLFESDNFKIFASAAQHGRFETLDMLINKMRSIDSTNALCVKMLQSASFRVFRVPAAGPEFFIKPKDFVNISEEAQEKILQAQKFHLSSKNSHSDHSVTLELLISTILALDPTYGLFKEMITSDECRIFEGAVETACLKNIQILIKKSMEIDPDYHLLKQLLLSGNFKFFSMAAGFSDRNILDFLVNLCFHVDPYGVFFQEMISHQDFHVLYQALYHGRKGNIELILQKISCLQNAPSIFNAVQQQFLLCESLDTYKKDFLEKTICSYLDKNYISEYTYKKDFLEKTICSYLDKNYISESACPSESHTVLQEQGIEVSSKPGITWLLSDGLDASTHHTAKKPRLNF